MVKPLFEVECCFFFFFFFFFVFLLFFFVVFFFMLLALYTLNLTMSRIHDCLDSFLIFSKKIHVGIDISCKSSLIRMKYHSFLLTE